MQLGFLDALHDDWQPISKAARTAWLIFYGLFLLYAVLHKGPGLFIDLVFLPIHEGGHLLFRWCGETLCVMGGTILQLFVPFAIAVYFAFERHLAGTAFASFFLFENFLNVGTYMADARAQALQYVTVGDGEAEHDWTFMFIKLGVLEHDTTIGGAVRVLGWLGMVGVIVWFWRKTATVTAARDTS